MKRFLLALLFISIYFIAPSSYGQSIVANFTMSTDTGCNPTIVQFTNTSSGSPSSYSWSFGDGGTSLLVNPAHTYNSIGTFTVTLTISLNGVTSTQSKTVTIFGTPIVDFSGSPLSGCPPLTVNFTDNSNPVVPGPATYNWSFGDGTSSSNQNPVHSFNYPGLYTIILNVTNSKGCDSSKSKIAYINVFQPPVADFAFNTVCKAPGTANFTTSITAGTGASPFTYSWDFGDNTTGTGNNPNHTYTSSGNYNVKLIVTDANGCKDTVTKLLDVGTLHADFITPDSICKGIHVFINSSVSAQYNVWDFGDNSLQTTTVNGLHLYTIAGTYNVRLIVTNGAQTCHDTIIKQVTVVDGPSTNFNITPTIPCSAPDTLFFTNTTTTTAGTTYKWYFGDGDTSTLVNPYHVYTTDSIYTITLVATDAMGCTNAKSKVDTFFDIKSIILINHPTGTYDHCAPTTIQFSDSLTFKYQTLIPSIMGWYYVNLPISITSAYWDFGDGHTSTSLTPTHTYNTTGIYQVISTVTTSNGCPISDTATITVGTPPTASFSVVEDTLCNNGYQTFINNSTNATEYKWYIYQGANDWQYDAITYSNSPNLAVTMTNAQGIYSVTLVASNNGCTDTFTINNAFTVLAPQASAIIQPSCDTLTLVSFQDISVGTVTSRIWDFGDGTYDTAKNTTHNYASLGSYLVKLSVFNSITGCHDSIVKNILLYVPNVTFYATDTALCKGDTIYFNASTSDPIGSVGYLTPGGGSPPGFGGWIYAIPGVFDVFMQVVDINGCIDTVTKNNYILVADPHTNFQAVPPIGCAPFLANFTESGSNTPGAYTTQWYWDFGDNTNTTTNTASISHSYPPGIYDVTLIIHDNVGCADTLTRQQYIESHGINAIFKADDTTACLNQVITFTNTSVSSTNSILTYKWDFGDGSPTSTTKSPTHAYTQTGSFTVSLIATDNIGCADTLTYLNYVKVAQPAASFTLNDSFGLCPPLNVQFTNTSTGAANYNWSFGDGSSSIIPSPVNIYINPGVYTIQLVAINSYGCKDTAYDSVRVLGFAGGLTYHPLKGCNPLNVSFNATLTGINNFLWDFGDGNIQTANGLAASHIYTIPGKFLPKMVFTDSAGCVNSSSGLDTIFIDDILSDFVFTPACVNTPITLTDTSYSFLSSLQHSTWNVNNGQATGNQKNITVNFSAPGTYPVTLISQNSNGCIDTLQRSIEVFGLPIISAGLDTSICLGDAATLMASGGISYVWTPANNLGCDTCQSTHASPLTTTNYIVTGTDVNGCKNIDTVTVIIQTKTTSTVALGGEICKDSSFQLHAYGATSYTWIPSESLDDANIANPIASPQSTTDYMVIAKEGSCEPDTNKIKVIVHPLPTVNAGTDETIIAGTSITLNATGTLISNYRWSPTSSLSCETCSSPTANPTATTVYTVTVSSSFGCIAKDEVTVNVLCDQSQVFIPNTFSPNGDGENDVFYPRGVGLRIIESFRVYNRWGEIIFERKNIQLNDAAAAWDGTYKGKTLSPDVFVYVVEGLCDGGDRMIWKGDINLIR